MMEKLAVIINGKAAQRKRALVDQYLAALHKQQFNLEVVETSHPQHATTIAKQAYDRGITHFACMGGDGTNFEVINGLFPINPDSARKPKLILLPLGTGNSFLKDFSKDNPLHSLQAFERRKVVPCDAIEVRHPSGTFYFMNLLSLGFVADVAFLRNKSFSAFGTFGYVLAVIAKTLTLKATTFQYTLNDHRQKTDHTFLSFDNSKYTGGNMMMAPLADTSDGLVDMIAVEPMGRLELLATFPKIFTGDHLRHDKVRCEQISKIDFHGMSARAVMVDGESLKIAIDHLRVIPQALEIYA